jgi:hypothetical protein
MVYVGSIIDLGIDALRPSGWWNSMGLREPDATQWGSESQFITFGEFVRQKVLLLVCF